MVSPFLTGEIVRFSPQSRVGLLKPAVNWVVSPSVP
jgi:hypothetical protein